MIPDNLRPFIWDVDPETFEPEAHPDFVIARLVEFGDLEAVAWMREQFGDEAIKAVVRSERRLTPRSANFWALVYRIPRQDVAALR